MQVELPAGLIDKGETAEAAALRELKEETGYIGSVLRVSQEVCMTPGMTDETVKVQLHPPPHASCMPGLGEGWRWRVAVCRVVSAQFCLSIRRARCMLLGTNAANGRCMIIIGTANGLQQLYMECVFHC